MHNVNSRNDCWIDGDLDDAENMLAIAVAKRLSLEHAGFDQNSEALAKACDAVSVARAALLATRAAVSAGRRGGRPDAVMLPLHGFWRTSMSRRPGVR